LTGAGQAELKRVSPAACMARVEVEELRAAAKAAAVLNATNRILTHA
jgi:hypothetical protein